MFSFYTISFAIGWRNDEEKVQMDEDNDFMHLKKKIEEVWKIIVLRKF